VHALAPLAAEILPEAHDVHAVAPSHEYVPAAQVLQTVETAAVTVVEKVPRAHMSQFMPPTRMRYWPAGQLVHAEEPCAEYLPTAHLTQTVFEDSAE